MIGYCRQRVRFMATHNRKRYRPGNRTVRCLESGASAILRQSRHTSGPTGRTRST
jgi:hypothetical protein